MPRREVNEIRTTSLAEAGQHWARFYRAAGSTPFAPSAFARHVAGRLRAPTRVVDMACGNGRDSAFFASLGHAVLGVDRCPEAVALARRLSPSLSLLVAEATQSEAELAAHLGGGGALLYGRFFLHALPETEATAFLRLAARALPPGGLLALEYRTLRDAALPKAHGGHFRRFVDHVALLGELRGLGFETLEETEGQDLAPYGQEDPVVGRVLASRAGGG